MDNQPENPRVGSIPAFALVLSVIAGILAIILVIAIIVHRRNKVSYTRLEKAPNPRSVVRPQPGSAGKRVFAPDESNPRPAYSMPLRPYPTHTTYHPPLYQPAGDLAGVVHHPPRVEEERQGLLSTHQYEHRPRDNRGNQQYYPQPPPNRPDRLQPERRPPSGPRRADIPSHASRQSIYPNAVRAHGGYAPQQVPGQGSYKP